MEPTVATRVRQPAALPISESVRELIRAEVERICSSPGFEKAQRRKDLLVWMVQRTLDGQQVSELAIAAWQNKGDQFDPTVDSSIRVDVSRLRTALESFYGSDGRHDAVMIAIPRRSYSPVFWIGAPVAATPVTPPAEGVPEPAAETTLPRASSYVLDWRKPGLLRWLLAHAAVATCILAGIGIWLTFRSPEPASVMSVTTLPGLAGQPTLSPDRKTVVFAWSQSADETTRLYVKRLDTVGGEKLLTRPGAPARSPAFSPDGKTIAWLRTNDDLSQDVMVADPSGRNERRLTTIATTVDGIAWTRDSRSVIVPDSGGTGLLGLFAVSLGSGERRQLTAFRSFFHPCVSPDGKLLAFATDTEPGRRGGLYLMPIAADGLPAGPPRLLEPTVAMRAAFPSWAIDGRTLYYIRSGVGESSTWRYHVESAKAEPVPAAGAGTMFVQEVQAGTLLVVRRQSRYVLVKLVDRDGRPESAPLSRSVEYHRGGVASPDGKLVAYSSVRGEEQRLFLSSLEDGGESEIKLAPGMAVQAGYWSPNGRWYYFEGWDAEHSAHHRVYRADIRHRGAAAQVVPLDDADNRNPSVSRDAKWIYYVSNASGAYQIWRARIDGGEPSKEVVVHEIDSNARAFAEEAPDGKTLFHTSPSGISRMSLATRRSEPFYTGTQAFFRLTAGGVLIQRISAQRNEAIQFVPFEGGKPSVLFRPGHHLGWTALANERGVLVSSVLANSNLELVRLPEH